MRWLLIVGAVLALVLAGLWVRNVVSIDEQSSVAVEPEPEVAVIESQVEPVAQAMPEMAKETETVVSEEQAVRRVVVDRMG